MGKLSAEDIRGLEFDWLASDGDGNVGFFSTAGGGFAPEEFLQDADAHERAIDSILSLAPRTLASCTRQSRPGLTNTWQMMAERGIFAFDSDPLGGPYQRVASPAVPIPTDDLPDEAAEVARRNTYPHLRFYALTEISADQLEKRRRNGP